MEELVKEPGFEHAVRYVMPDVDYPAFSAQLLNLESCEDFKRHVMASFLEMIVAKTTDGLSVDGLENCKPDKCYTFISNHRDIVLDATLLNLCLMRHDLPLTQVAIGNNLLIYDWITKLVKINGSFIVKRDTGIREALDAARHLSEYIHYIVGGGRQSIWIAQREGRAKDSNDVTQESVVKMLALAGSDDAKESLGELNISPVAISYEYDPNDYLKVREFLLRQRDPDFHKSQRDDLFSMETGILKQKGHVHFSIGRCINEKLAGMQFHSRSEVTKAACAVIDHSIHCGYRIYPCNYIAYDETENVGRYRAFYSSADVEKFHDYIDHQLSKVEEPDITAEERQFMRHTILMMYANPLRNQLEAQAELTD